MRWSTKPFSLLAGIQWSLWFSPAYYSETSLFLLLFLSRLSSGSGWITCHKCEMLLFWFTLFPLTNLIYKAHILSLPYGFSSFQAYLAFLSLCFCFTFLWIWPLSHHTEIVSVFVSLLIWSAHISRASCVWRTILGPVHIKNKHFILTDFSQQLRRIDL